MTSLRIGVYTSFLSDLGLSTGFAFCFTFTTLAAMSFTLIGLRSALVPSISILQYNRSSWGL